MAFELWPAAAAGAIAGATMMIARLALRAAGLPLRMDVTRIWGTLVGVRGQAQRPVGVVVHIFVSIAVALIYAAAFDAVGASSALALWGLAASLVHWVIAGVMMTILPVAHPEIAGEREAAGMFVKNFGGPDVAGFLVGHVAYGITVAIAYAWLARGVEAAF